MKHYLVTGGAGYIGSHVVRLLLDEGHTVIVFDNLSTGNKENIDERALFVEGSILDQRTLNEVMKGMDGVFHFAAKLLVGESVEQPIPYYETNVTGSMNVMRAMHSAQIQNIIFSSTAVVYDENAPQPLKEDAPTRPMNPYGWSKLMTEQMLADVSRVSPLNYVTLRYFNVAGKADWYIPNYTHDTHLLPAIIEVIEGKRDVLKIFGTDYDTRDGSCIRDYVHVQDIARAHIDAIRYLEEGGESDVFNVGTNEGTTVLEMLDAAQQTLGVEIPSEKVDRRPGDPPILIADNTKITQTLHWKAQHTINDMLKDSR